MQQPVVPAMQPGHQPVATIGVLPIFAVPTPTTLVIREKVLSLSGDDFAYVCAAYSGSVSVVLMHACTCGWYQRQGQQWSRGLQSRWQVSQLAR